MALNRNQLIGIYDSQGDADAIKYFNAVIANGGTLTASIENAITKFVLSLKSNGTWNLIYDMALFAGATNLFGNSGIPKLKTVTPYTKLVNYNFIPSTDYVATGSTAGIKGNGTSKYLDTQFNPLVYSSQVTNFSLFGYVQGYESIGTSRAIIGAQQFVDSSTTNTTILGWVNNGDLDGGGIGAVSVPTQYSPDSVNNAGIQRQGALQVTTNGSNTVNYYKDGTLINNPSTTTGRQPNLSFYVGAANTISGASYYSTRYIRGYAIAQGMSATQANSFASNWDTLMTAFGAYTT
jgi:hypothetical protein